jgi:hypothetical protein
MNGPDPVRPDLASALAPLLREWAQLREQEVELFRRIAETLERSTTTRPAAGDASVAVPDGASPLTSPGVSSSLTEGTPADPVAPTPGAAPDPAGAPGAAPGPVVAPGADPTGDPSWIDRTIDAVLAGAFSADEEDDEAPELPAVELLLLRSANTWVGMPWDSVAGLGLSDESSPSAEPAAISLHDLLARAGHHGEAHAVEPYRLTWESPRGLRALSCEVLGGVVAATAAVSRGVELIWVPDESEAGCRLVPMVEFFVTGQGPDPARAASPDPVGPVPPPPPDPASPVPDPAPPAPSSTLAPSSVPSGETPAVPAPSAPRPLIPRRLDPPVAVSVAPVPPAPGATLASPSPQAPEAAEPPTQSHSVPPAAGTLRSVPMPEAPGTVGDPPVANLPVPAPPAGDAPRKPEPVLGVAAGPRANTSLSALVSVRYLPARVAISRFLKSAGWFVLEAADPQELPAMLRRVHHSAVFTEAPDRPDPAWIEALMQARADGARVIGVASRLRVATVDPLRSIGDLPRLLYPFQEAELERLVGTPAQPERG